MKQPISILSKQDGFTLLESLVGLMIFTIIILGSGVVLNRMLNTQAQTTIDSVVIDEMQGRLQGAIDRTATASTTTATTPCDLVKTAPLSFNGKTYYVACRVKEVSKLGSTIVLAKAPYLAVSETDQATADSCASSANPDSDCYIVGK